MKRGYWEAVSLIMGTIIGAGVLGLPYAAATVGIPLGVFIITLIGAAIIYIHLILGELTLRSKERHQLPGYIEPYLGRWSKHVMLLAFLVSDGGAIVAYLLGESTILHQFFPAVSPQMLMILFFMFASIIVMYGLKVTGKAELASTIAMLILIGGIVTVTIPSIQASNFGHMDYSKIALPLGITLFASLGMVAIPGARALLYHAPKLLKKAIFVGTVIPVLLYIVFTLALGGAISKESFEQLPPNERIATIALGKYVNPTLGVIANIFAMTAMFTSFLSISLALIWLLQYDYHFPKPLATVCALVVPLGIALTGISSFIEVLAWSGAIGGGVQAMMIIMAHQRAKKSQRKPEYKVGVPAIVAVLLIGLFVFGIVTQFM